MQSPTIFNEFGCPSPAQSPSLDLLPVGCLLYSPLFDSKAIQQCLPSNPILWVKFCPSGRCHQLLMPFIQLTKHVLT